MLLNVDFALKLSIYTSLNVFYVLNESKVSPQYYILSSTLPVTPLKEKIRQNWLDR